MKNDSSNTSHEHSIPFPVFIYLTDMKVVCVGGGRCAERKIDSLLSYDADITVVAPKMTRHVRELALAGRIALFEREYRKGDLSGASFVIGATDDPLVNHQVYLDAISAHKIVNVVDDPANCNAILPSVLRRGPLQIAVSTSGSAPGVAREVRRSLEDRFPAWYGEYLLLVGEVRRLIKDRVAGDAKRRAPLCEAVYASDLEERFAQGERPSAEEVFDSVVAPLLSGREGL